MKIQEMQEKYSLDSEDFWFNEPSKKYIIKHDAIEKIMEMEGIVIIDWFVDNSEMDLVRYRLKLQQTDEDGVIRQVQTCGEADRKNCRSQYLGCIAEKRAIDRGVLKLINAYQFNVASDVESEDYKEGAPGTAYYYTKTEEEKAAFDKLIHHICFKNRIKSGREAFKKCNSQVDVHSLLEKMKAEIKIHNNQGDKN